MWFKHIYLHNCCSHHSGVQEIKVRDVRAAPGVDMQAPVGSFEHNCVTSFKPHPSKTLGDPIFWGEYKNVKSALTWSEGVCLEGWVRGFPSHSKNGNIHEGLSHPSAAWLFKLRLGHDETHQRPNKQFGTQSPWQ